MTMRAIDFVNEYQQIVVDISNVVKPEYFPAIDVLLDTDPHDLISPDTVFLNRDHAYGFVYSLMVKMHREMKS